MRKQNKITKTVTFFQTVGMTCDKCGKKFSSEDEILSVHSFTVSYAYNSGKDGSEEFDICEDCLNKFFKSFVHKPREKTFRYDGS